MRWILFGDLPTYFSLTEFFSCATSCMWHCATPLKDTRIPKQSAGQSFQFKENEKQTEFECKSVVMLLLLWMLLWLPFVCQSPAQLVKFIIWVRTATASAAASAEDAKFVIQTQNQKQCVSGKTVSICLLAKGLMTSSSS